MAVNQSQVDRALKVLDKARELHAQAFDCIEEARRIFSGADATGDVLKRIEAAFSMEWERLYGARYTFAYVKDRPHWKRLLKHANEPDIVARIIMFMHDTDPYVVRAKHSFGIFVSQFNRYVQATPFALETAPVNCEHDPPCKNDAEHTRRAQGDIRGNR